MNRNFGFLESDEFILEKLETSEFSSNYKIIKTNQNNEKESLFNSISFILFGKENTNFFHYFEKKRKLQSLLIEDNLSLLSKIINRTIVVVESNKISFSSTQIQNNNIPKKSVVLCCEKINNQNIYYPLIRIWKVEEIEDEFFQLLEKKIEITNNNKRKIDNKENSIPKKKNCSLNVKCIISEDCKYVFNDFNKLEHFNDHCLQKEKHKLLFCAMVTHQQEYPNTTFDAKKFLEFKTILTNELKNQKDIIENHPDFQLMKLLFGTPYFYNGKYYIVISLDFETTKLTKDPKLITQIASFIHLKEYLGKGFSCFVKPNENFNEYNYTPPNKFYYHTVTNEVVKDAMGIITIFQKYCDWIKLKREEIMKTHQLINLDILIIAHNAKYEQNLFQAAQKLCNINFDFEITFVDTINAITNVLGCKETSLSKILDYFGISKEGHHIATTDIKLLSIFLEKIFFYYDQFEKNFLNGFSKYLTKKLVFIGNKELKTQIKLILLLHQC